jgi:hypothetical protein
MMDDDSPLGCLLVPLLFLPGLFEGVLRSFVAMLEGVTTVRRGVRRRITCLLGRL